MHKLTALAVLATTLQAEPTIRRLDGTRISTQEAEIQATQILKEAKVTGAQIAILDKGQLTWSAAFGQRRRDPSLPFDKETNTWAASITKGVFATYVMQLVEKEEFNLDDPITKQLTKPLNTYDPYKDTATEIIKDPVWPQVTPRHLLSHTTTALLHR